MVKRKRSSYGMASRKKKRRSYYKAKRRYSRSVVRVNRSLTPFPNGMVAKIRFCDNILLDANTGSVSYNVFRANSIWDPRQTLGGAQARGFDEYMTVYEKWRVLGSKIHCRFINDKVAQTSTNENGCVAFAGLVNNATDYPTSIVEAVEQRQFTTKVLGNMQSAQFHKSITRKFSAKKHWNGSPPWTEDVFEGGANSDCLKQCFYIVGCGNYDLTENPAAVHCLVVVDYVVKFYQPKQLAQS